MLGLRSHFYIIKRSSHFKLFKCFSNAFVTVLKFLHRKQDLKLYGSLQNLNCNCVEIWWLKVEAHNTFSYFPLCLVQKHFFCFSANLFRSFFSRDEHFHTCFKPVNQNPCSLISNYHLITLTWLSSFSCSSLLMRQLSFSSGVIKLSSNLNERCPTSSRHSSNLIEHIFG